MVEIYAVVVRVGCLELLDSWKVGWFGGQIPEVCSRCSTDDLSSTGIDLCAASPSSRSSFANDGGRCFRKFKNIGLDELITACRGKAAIFVGGSGIVCG